MTDAVEMTPLIGKGRRCPWFKDVIDLSAAPRVPYDRWVGAALIYAGSHAWELAKPARDRGCRAVTVLPPGADALAMRWPPVGFWLGRMGDLPATDVVNLARVLIGAGATSVNLVAASIAGGVLTVRVS